jgi:hypothetical protein
MTAFMGLGVTEPEGSEWWAAFSPELKMSIADWIAGEGSRLGVTVIWDRVPAHVDGLLRSFDRAAADGGGFVVGSSCMCPPTAAGGVTQTIASDRMCPAGSGGVGGTVTRELSTEEMRAEALRISEEARRTWRSGVVKRTTTITTPPDSSDSSTPLIVGGLVVAALVAWLVLS